MPRKYAAIHGSNFQEAFQRELSESTVGEYNPLCADISKNVFAVLGNSALIDKISLSNEEYFLSSPLMLSKLFTVK